MYLLSCMLNVICNLSCCPRAALSQTLTHTHIHTFLYSTRLVELSRVAFSPLPRHESCSFPMIGAQKKGFAISESVCYCNWFRFIKLRNLPFPSRTHSDISSVQRGEQRKEKKNKTKQNKK